MSAGQRVDVLGKGATRAGGVKAPEAPHLDRKDDPPVEHRPLGQGTDIPSVQLAAPASAGRTRCGAHRTAGFHRDCASPVGTADHALAHLRENPVHRVDQHRHDAKQDGIDSGRLKPSKQAVTQSAEDPQSCPKRDGKDVTRQRGRR